MMQRQRSALGALLAFAQDELQDLKPKRLEQVRKTIADVAGQVGRADAVARVSGLLRRQEWVEEIEEELPWGDGDIRELTCEKLGDLQTTLNECLAALFPVGGFGDAPGGSAHLPVDLPVHMEHIHIQRRNAGVAAPVEILFVAKGWRDAFWLSTAGLLEQFGSYVRRCQNPKCAKMFVRKTCERYCSGPCGASIRNRKYYDAHKRRPPGARGRLKK